MTDGRQLVEKLFAKLHKFLGTRERFPKTLIMHERQP